ncbi:hypothetical protein O7614_14575 [Micromonospora sp. WMMD961]|uniref:hypothetical protein n=1 Tax=Micromonospora sp. WMMD961 TaxID=3016100 RepID=UPI002415A0BB|nr:hypothetical protein [Micromonospora sp. WMMD961]MDG4780868.1 hypothetical protein [Micromonospora sp. WMMD961]
MNDTPSTPADVLAAVDRTPYGAVVRDEARRRQMVYESLASGPDPIGREIGRQLRDGDLSPRDLLTVGDYQGFLSRARTQAERLDLDDLAAAARSAAIEEGTSHPADERPHADRGWAGYGDESSEERPWR